MSFSSFTTWSKNTYHKHCRWYTKVMPNKSGARQQYSLSRNTSNNFKRWQILQICSFFHKQAMHIEDLLMFFLWTSRSSLTLHRLNAMTFQRASALHVNFWCFLPHFREFWSDFMLLGLPFSISFNWCLSLNQNCNYQNVVNIEDLRVTSVAHYFHVWWCLMWVTLNICPQYLPYSM